ncbi:MAG: hypothetical protein F6J87_19620 [Spirulina sp. SIO3F2]|nr:hypothetical protein [Spirulina sp. SIO3F2]
MAREKEHQWAQDIYEAIAPLQTEAEIAAKCKEFEDAYYQDNQGEPLEIGSAAWKKRRNSLGSKMSRSGLNKRMKTIPRTPTNSATWIGGLGEKSERHLFFKYFGLSKHYFYPLNSPERKALEQQGWNSRNASSKRTERLEESVELDPTPFIETAQTLCQHHEDQAIAAGLIAATGRRPHEIVARAKFSPIKGNNHAVQFTGQGKKRGKKPTFIISTLLPAPLVIEALHRLRRDPHIQEIITDARKNYPRDITRQNDSIDSRTNKRINRIVCEAFKDTLPIRSEEEDQQNCTMLRAAAAALVTERDCQGSVGMKMLFAGRQLGHIDPDDENTSDPERVKNRDAKLRHVLTTIGYMSYYITKEVPHPSMPKPTPEQTLTSEDRVNFKVNPNDADKLREWAKRWSTGRKTLTQYETIAIVVDLAQKALEHEENEPMSSSNPAIEALERQNENLTQQVAELSGQVSAIMQMIKQGIETPEKASKPVQKEQIKPESTPQVKPQSVKRSSVVHDFSVVNNETLWSEDYRRLKGASEERLERCLKGMMHHNNQYPAGINTEQKWFIGFSSIKALSGASNSKILALMSTYKLTIEEHNTKHGLDEKHNIIHRKKRDIKKTINPLDPTEAAQIE